MLTMQTEQTAPGGNGLRTAQWRRRGVLLVLSLVIALLGLSTIDRPAYAEDELYLTGIIKTVNQVTGVAYVEVVSSSCHGMRTFRADEPEKLGNLTGRKISFFIDSNRCRDDSVHTMLVSRGIRK